ncbi:MAG TPA: hypothetical protein VEC11_11980 [Allosphingosinicella sp.]|nr:hypothetical protein [Allosphingosinicella sp.]
MSEDKANPSELQDEALDQAQGGLLPARPISRRPPPTTAPDIDSDGREDIVVTNLPPPV